MGRHRRRPDLDNARRRKELEEHYAARTDALEQGHSDQASHFDDQSAYASVSRFRIDDLHPYIYRTHDGGKTWKLISVGLPDDAPVDTVREDPVRKGLLFAGTETSVWVSFDDGDHWQALAVQSAAHVDARLAASTTNDLIVATHGRSFWILDDIAPAAAACVEASSAAVSFQTRNGLSRPAQHAIPIRRFRSMNPRARILPTAHSSITPCRSLIPGPVTLEILDAQARWCARMQVPMQPEASQAEAGEAVDPALLDAVCRKRFPPSRACIAGYGICIILLQPRCNSSIRFRRFPTIRPERRSVHLRYPENIRFDSMRTGALSRRLLTIKIDPRVSTSRAGLQQQFNLEMRLASELTSSTEAVTQARSLVDQLHKLGTQSGKLAESIKALDQKVGAILRAPMPTDPGSSEPTLTRSNALVGTLYESVGQADAAPTAAQKSAAVDTERDLSAVMKRWEDIEKSDLPALNRQLKSANLPEIHLESKPPTGESQADLE